ncbi:transposase [bacterium]|nr:transposase [bacterium]
MTSKLVPYHNGNILLRLKNAYADGTSHLKFTPDQFIRRVISLIPPPRENFIRYFGLFGARNKNRKEVTSKASPRKEKKKKIIYRTPWADLLKRVYKFEVDYCDSCGSKLKLISSITSCRICKKILDHLGLDSELVIESRPRGPPTQFSQCENDKNNINQEYNW